MPRSGVLGWLGLKRDPTAHERADPNVHIAGWSSTKPASQAQAGDVIAQAHGSWGHAGVVVAPGQTVSVNSTTNPAGIVTQNNWGFRPTGGNGEGPHDPAPVNGWDGKGKRPLQCLVHYGSCWRDASHSSCCEDCNSGLVKALTLLWFTRDRRGPRFLEIPPLNRFQWKHR